MRDDNGCFSAAKPPMGWNSWDSYGSSVTEAEVLSNAEFMSEHLLRFGWDTVVIDIDWYDPTASAHHYNDGAPLLLDEYGRQLPDPGRFPSATDGNGFASLAQRLHDMGLKLGLHMMRGVPRLAVERHLPVKGAEGYTAADIADREHVCRWNPDNFGINQSHPAAQALYDAQVDLFASWGVDFLKVDDMQAPFYSAEIAAYHKAIVKAEAKYGTQIVLSLSPGTWNSTTHVDFLRKNAQMWRISDDLWDRWDDVYQQFVRLSRWAPFQTNGHWADADMLPLGHIGVRAHNGDSRDCKLTVEERRTLMALWCMGRSPLMVGGDLPTSTPETVALLANPVLGEVGAGSVDNREVGRERIYRDGPDHPDSYLGDLIIWSARAADWGDGTVSAHQDGYYGAVFWTGSEAHEIDEAIELQTFVGIENGRTDYKLTDLFADVVDGASGAAARLDGSGADRMIRGTVPAHGVLWFAIDPR